MNVLVIAKVYGMEITIGIQNIGREISFVSTQSAADIEKAVTDSLNPLKGGPTLSLSDEKGRRFIVPATAIGYVAIGEEEPRKVGFGV